MADLILFYLITIYMKSLLDYVGIYHSVVNKDLCDEILHELNIAEYIEHGFYSHSDKKRFKTDAEPYISHTEIEKISYLNDIVNQCLITYVYEKSGGYLPGFDGFTNVRFNKYQKGQIMSKHCDRVQEMFDGERKGIPTLSVVGLLNDDFTGGDFIMFEDTKINLEKGTVIVFPSTFMYPHRVTEVKTGIRHSFVSWSW